MLFSRADLRESMVFYDFFFTADVCTDVFTSRLPTRSVQQSKTRAPVLWEGNNFGIWDFNERHNKHICEGELTGPT